MEYFNLGSLRKDATRSVSIKVPVHRVFHIFFSFCDIFFTLRLACYLLNVSIMLHVFCVDQSID